MEPIGALLVGSTAVSAAVASLIARRNRGLRRKLSETSVQRDAALAAEAASTRLLRLSAADLRETALTLLGHTDKLRGRADGDARKHAAAIAAATSRVLSLADDLQDTAVPDSDSRVLRDQGLRVAGLLRDTVAAVAATLDPSRRNWRFAPELGDLVLLGDRRAVSQVLRRVLSNAARFTRDGDWIDIGLERSDGHVAITVADEGAGLTAEGSAPAPGHTDSRGVGLGLSLARVLMEAHGGALAIEAAARIGTRVILTFPAERVVTEALDA